MSLSLIHIWVGRVQELFALVLVGQAGGLIEVDFALQNAVHGRVPQGLEDLITEQKQQPHDVREEMCIRDRHSTAATMRGVSV